MLVLRYDDPVGRFIIKLTWGCCTKYPSYIIASESLLEHWLQTKEEQMTNGFNNLNAPTEAPKFTDEQLAEMLASKPVDGTIAFVSTDDGDEVEEAKTIN